MKLDPIDFLLTAEAMFLIPLLGLTIFELRSRRKNKLALGQAGTRKQTKRKLGTYRITPQRQRRRHNRVRRRLLAMNA